MGWSCAHAASETLGAWTAACVAQTGSSNCYRTSRGSYFFEVSRTEHYDGAITGTIWREIPPLPGDGPDTRRCRRGGSFRIEPDGKVSRAPAFLKAAAKALASCDGCGRKSATVESCGRDANGDPDAPDLCETCRAAWEHHRAVYDGRTGSYVSAAQLEAERYS